jgi:hypothetical protein
LLLELAIMLSLLVSNLLRDREIRHDGVRRLYLREDRHQLSSRKPQAIGNDVTTSIAADLPRKCVLCHHIARRMDTPAPPRTASAMVAARSLQPFGHEDPADTFEIGANLAKLFPPILVIEPGRLEADRVQHG